MYLLLEFLKWSLLFGISILLTPKALIHSFYWTDHLPHLVIIKNFSFIFLPFCVVKYSHVKNVIRAIHWKIPHHTCSQPLISHSQGQVMLLRYPNIYIYICMYIFFLSLSLLLVFFMVTLYPAFFTKWILPILSYLHKELPLFKKLNSSSYGLLYGFYLPSPI